jgi:hypothetical protein
VKIEAAGGYGTPAAENMTDLAVPIASGPSGATTPPPMNFASAALAGAALDRPKTESNADE